MLLKASEVILMQRQKLSVKGIAIASAILWGGAIFFVHGANWMWPEYGKAFLEGVSSIYPGYNAEPTLSSITIGTVMAVADGAVGGALFAWLYNLCSRN